MSKKYQSPPKRSDFEYFMEFSDLQIVILCELELLRNDKKFRRSDGPNPQQLLNNFIINWRDNEFPEISFHDKSSFQVDLQKIIPFKWSAFGDMADKNHLPVFKDNLCNEDLAVIDSLFAELNNQWEKDYREYKSISILTDEEMVVKWNHDLHSYEEIK